MTWEDPAKGLTIFHQGDLIYFYDVNRGEWIRAIFSNFGYDGSWYMIAKPHKENVQRFKLIPSMSPQKLAKGTRVE